MKGMVFTEFLDMVEEKFGLETTDHIITAADTETDGAYTAVGNYDYREMVHMVVALSDRTNLPVPTLLHAFGEHLFGVFANNYGQFFAGTSNTFEFLGSIEDTIHVEVRKLYPDAELPSFSYPQRADDTLVMEYTSARPLAHFAHGLIDGCIGHFGESIEVEMQDLSDGAGTAARFTLTK